jgi:ribosome-associated protein
METFLRITPGVHIPEAELHFSFSRSGGPGGQNVNKLATRVELRFDVAASPSLSDDQKMLVRSALKGRIDAEGVLRLQVQESRSQWQNRRRAVERFVDLLQNALRIRPRRRRTKPTAASRERRYAAKKRKSVVKRLRGGSSRDE